MLLTMPTMVLTNAVPAAIASNTTRGKPSPRDGCTKMSAAA